MIKILIDNNTLLRYMETNNADELFTLIDSSRSYLRQWLPWLDVIRTARDTRGYIDAIERQYLAKQGLQTGIYFNGKIAGVIGFPWVDWINRYAFVGYWLGEKYQGIGLMTKACQAIINYAFTNLNLNRVEIRCAIENQKSRAIPERLKFVREGIIRDGEWLYDHYVDHVVYGMLARDWHLELTRH